MTSQDTTRRWLALALLAATQFVVVLDTAVVNIALPSIGADLRVSPDDLAWVVNAYVLAFGGLLLLGGRAADLLGRRRVFMAGLLTFALASLAGGFAQSEWHLVAARAVQGLGAAVVSPAALSIVVATFRDGGERNKAMGVWAAVGGAGGAVGVLLGGLLTGSLGWQWVFWVNVPVALGAVALAPILLPESRADAGGPRFDLAGALSATAGLTVLVYALLGADEAGWRSLRTIALFAAAAGLLASFLWIERRVSNPLVPFRFLRQRSVAAGNLTALLVFGAWFPAVFFLSLYLQRGLGYEPLTAGLAFLPLSLGIIVSTRFASRLATRFGVRRVLPAALLLMALGLAWFSQASAGGSFISEVLGPALVLAVGFGGTVVAVFIVAMSGVDGRESGLASGLVNTAQQVGGALGLAILVTVASSRSGAFAAEAGASSSPVALVEGFQAAFLGAAGFALAAALTALVLVPGRSTAAHRVPPSEGEPAEAGVG